MTLQYTSWGSVSVLLHNLSKQLPCLNISNSENVSETDYYLKHATLEVIRDFGDDFILPMLFGVNLRK